MRCVGAPHLYEFSQTMGDLPADSVVISSESNSCTGEKATNPVQAHLCEIQELRAIPGLWSQVYAAMALSVATFLSGIAEGWPGSMSLKLTEPDTIELFYGKHNRSSSEPPHTFGQKEIGQIYFFMILAALVHMMITGVLMDQFGRKAGCWFLNFVAPSGWALLATAGSISQVQLGAALIGSVAVSGEAVGVVYISEVSNDRIRGTLISVLMFFNSLGILVAHVLGEEMQFYAFSYICLVVTLSFPFFFWHLPESPQFLMLQSRVREARDSVAWYNGNDSIIIDSEMKKLENAKKFDLGECKTLLGTLSNRRAILIVLGLSVLTELAGTSLVEVFAGSTLAQIRHAKLSSKIASMCLAFCRFIGGILNVCFVERAGRKATLRISLINMGCCLVLLFVILKNTDAETPPHLHTEPPTSLEAGSGASRFYWSIACFVLYTLSNQMFLGTTEVLSGEILSADAKGAMFAFGGFARIGTLIMCVLFYNYALTLDVFGTWNIFSNFIFCFIGAHLTSQFIPETQGKTPIEIHQVLDAKNCAK